MTTPLEPNPGFDWTRVHWSGPSAPVDEPCSYCGAAIPESHIPLRLFSPESFGAVFCYVCMRRWWGLSMLEEDEDLH